MLICSFLDTICESVHNFQTKTRNRNRSREHKSLCLPSMTQPSFRALLLLFTLYKSPSLPLPSHLYPDSKASQMTTIGLFKHRPPSYLHLLLLHLLPYLHHHQPAILMALLRHSHLRKLLCHTVKAGHQITAMRYADAGQRGEEKSRSYTKSILNANALGQSRVLKFLTSIAYGKRKPGEV
jgi:hypothetical protein